MLLINAIFIDKIELNVNVIQQVGCVLTVLLVVWEYLLLLGEIKLTYQDCGNFLDIVSEVNNQLTLLLVRQQLLNPVSLDFGQLKLEVLFFISCDFTHAFS